MKVLAERLKELQAERSISNEKLAQRIDASQKSVKTWRNDEGDPSIKFLVALSEFFDVSPDYLLGRTDQRSGCQGSHHQA